MYSYIKQIDWESKFDCDAWITGLDGSTVHLPDNAGNRINNLPSHSIKINDLWRVSKSVSVHVNARYAFDYQQNDMLDQFVEAHQELVIQ
jgi:hypothetical protein